MINSIVVTNLTSKKELEESGILNTPEAMKILNCLLTDKNDKNSRKLTKCVKSITFHPFINSNEFSALIRINILLFGFYYKHLVEIIFIDNEYYYGFEFYDNVEDIINDIFNKCRKELERSAESLFEEHTDLNLSKCVIIT